MIPSVCAPFLSLELAAQPPHTHTHTHVRVQLHPQIDLRQLVSFCRTGEQSKQKGENKMESLCCVLWFSHLFICSFVHLTKIRFAQYFLYLQRNCTLFQTDLKVCSLMTDERWHAPIENRHCIHSSLCLFDVPSWVIPHFTNTRLEKTSKPWKCGLRISIFHLHSAAWSSCEMKVKVR